MEPKQEDITIVFTEKCPIDEKLSFESDKNLKVQSRQSEYFETSGRYINPLHINTVVSCIFEHVSLRQLKIFRAVSKMWKQEAKPVFKNRSRVTFSLFNNDGERKPKTPQMFMNEFGGTQSAEKFSSFRIITGDGYPISELTNFFEMKKKSIKELELAGLVLFNKDGSQMETVNIREWIKDAPISKFRITGSAGTTWLGTTLCHEALITIPLLHLNNVQRLDLQGHRLEIPQIPQDFQITPKDLQLGNVTVVQNGRTLAECVINDFVKFNKYTNLHARSYNPPATIFILDFGENFTAKKIHLTRNTRFINWRKSRCSIDTLELDLFSVFEWTNMKIKNLDVTTTRIDLDHLPRSLETLGLFVDNEGGALTCSKELILPKLKYLRIDAWHSAGLAHFANCANLTKVYIHCIGGNTPLNLNFVPESVNKLEIHGYIILEGQTNVDFLRIHQSTFSDATRILNRIKTKTVILHLDETRKHKLKTELIPFLQDSEDKTLYIGPIHYFGNLSQYVDKESKFYVFRNQKGIGINRMEFFKFFGNISDV